MATKLNKHLSLGTLIAIAACILILSSFLSSCSKRVLSVDEFRDEYDPSQDGYNYWEDSDDYYYEYMGY
jgi:hypothetical protein